MPRTTRSPTWRFDDSDRIALVGNTKAYGPESPRTTRTRSPLVPDATSGELLNELWSSDGDDCATVVAMDSCGGIALVGYTTGDLAGIAKGGRDAFVLVSHIGE